MSGWNRPPKSPQKPRRPWDLGGVNGPRIWWWTYIPLGCWLVEARCKFSWFLVCLWFFPGSQQNKPCRKKNMVKWSFWKKIMVLRKKHPTWKKKECWAGLRLPGDWWKNSTWRAVCLGEARGWDDGFVWNLFLENPNNTHRKSMGLVDVPTNLHSFTIKDGTIHCIHYWNLKPFMYKWLFQYDDGNTNLDEWEMVV